MNGKAATLPSMAIITKLATMVLIESLLYGLMCLTGDSLRALHPNVLIQLLLTHRFPWVEPSPIPRGPFIGEASNGVGV